MSGLDSTDISYAEDEVEVITSLAGCPGACLSLHLPLTERVYFLTSFVSYTDFLLQFPFYFSSDGENLRIRLRLLGYKEHLDLHLQVLLESTCLALLVSYHARRKPTMS